VKGLIRPWYRSRLFWLGLPGLVFLLWAWGYSNLTRHEFRIGSERGGVAFTQGKVFWVHLELDASHSAAFDLSDGDVAIWRCPPEMSFTPQSIGTGDFLEGSPLYGDDRRRRWFPPLRWEALRVNPDTGYRFISLPYWLLTAGFVVVWATAVVMRQRRKARLQKHSAASRA
jgi:hypothetical protein